jgi:uncharacterized membrane protein
MQRERYLQERAVPARVAVDSNGRVPDLPQVVLLLLVTAASSLPILAVLFDSAFLLGGNTRWLHVSYWLLAVGAASVAVVTVALLAGVLAHPRAARAGGIAVWFGFGNLLVVALSVTSWLARRADMSVPGAQAFLLAAMAAAVALLAGWLGSELAERVVVAKRSQAMRVSSMTLPSQPMSVSDAAPAPEFSHAAQA